MSGAGADPSCGRSPLRALRDLDAIGWVLWALAAIAAIGASRLAWQAAQSGEWALFALGLASLLALRPLPRLARALREPVVFLPGRHRSDPLQAETAGRGPFPVSVRRVVDGGSWMLLRLQPLDGGVATFRVLRESTGTGASAEPDAVAWAALRRDVLGADRRAEP